MIRDTTETNFAELLRLNLESEHFLSPMDRAQLEYMHCQAAYHRAACMGQEVVAFLLAFREGADYDSPNYRWFTGRYSSFLYVDRVVVGARHRGTKLGSALYRDLFRFAKEAGVPRVTCEFNVIPLNAVSSSFHSRFGFREVGAQWVSNGKKKVSLQEAPSSVWT